MKQEYDPNTHSDLESDRIMEERVLAQKEWLSQCRLIALECLHMEPVQHESFWRTLMCDLQLITLKRHEESMGIKFKGYWTVLGLPGGVQQILWRTAGRWRRLSRASLDLQIDDFLLPPAVNLAGPLKEQKLGTWFVLLIAE
jgi:hypothetical protein